MSYMLFALPLVGLLAVFGIVLRVPSETAANVRPFPKAFRQRRHGKGEEESDGDAAGHSLVVSLVLARDNYNYRPNR